jgi:ATP-dependent Lon protease
MPRNKNVKITETPLTNNSFVIERRIIDLQEIVKRTIIAVQKYKVMDVFGANELNVCVQSLNTIFQKLTQAHSNVLSKNDSKSESHNQEDIITKLQECTTELSSLFRTFGTDCIDDLISVCCGNEYIKTFTSSDLTAKYEVMRKYLHPIGYKVMHWNNVPQDSSPGKEIKKTRVVEDFMIMEQSNNLDCYDLSRTSKSFQTKVYGVKFAIKNTEQRKTLLVCAIVDDLMLECLNYSFVEMRIRNITENKPSDSMFQSDAFHRFVCCLTLKELLIYNDVEMYDRFMGYMSQVNVHEQKTIAQITKEFINNDLYGQRTTLIQLLLKSNDPQFQYLAYLLYDLLSNDFNGNIDTHEQTLLFDSLPWNVKKYFRDAMKQTVTYTHTLANFDQSKIPLEQQICLLKADDSVKDKAMLKLKEVKAKSEDSGTKARQYLEALLRIPFGIYREEPILTAMESCTSAFNEVVSKILASSYEIEGLPVKSSFSSVEMRKYCDLLSNNYESQLNKQMVAKLKHEFSTMSRSNIISNICFINGVVKMYKINVPKICHSGKTVSFMRGRVNDFLDVVSDKYNVLISITQYIKGGNQNDDLLLATKECITKITSKTETINQFIEQVGTILDNAVHGHKRAKRQVERIIGQWINGEKSGYCFGFEGPPGVGKTSLAKKGIAHCLQDEKGDTRPFAFIAIGGSSNGSTLDGHNYTYVGSTWGRIVDILMEHKCMNPIIFIDELDKVSRTEQGKEIIGILTHLIDPTQNDSFHDKYFNGIDLDLSNALFIFSYNDVDAIDRILLDRIHRIKFDHLSLEDKLTITNTYLLPEIYRKMGLEGGIISIDEDTIQFIIETYTCEPGVRKLKEVLFEILGEINLSILKNSDNYDIPISITIHDVKHKFLKDRPETKIVKISHLPRVGVICGLWANSLGMGGVLSIETKRFPSTSFLELKLTGMQGDVMKESMNVAKTLAWNMLSSSFTKSLSKEMKCTGIHVHVPEGSTPKDGPSAGTAITIAMYSLFTNKPIPGDIAITGEICLQGRVTAIGGLDLKILGGIAAGVKTFLFPSENEKDFKDFMEKYGKKELVKGVKFIQVSTIEEIIQHFFQS